MANIPDWKYFLRRVTIKDVIIAVLVITISFMWAFIQQTEHIVVKLNAENERLQVENERISHLLDMETVALQRLNEKSPMANVDIQLRDPFRPDHPTREELRERRENLGFYVNE